jgi:aspartyl-tRNA(Asn)/glutamyl-tRNA(Gln) amidotransferase subunit A
LDGAVLLQAIAGYDTQEVTSVDRPVPSYAAAVKRGTSSLRIGLPRENFFTALHPDVDKAVGQAIARLSELSVAVQEVNIPVSPDVNAIVQMAEAYAFHAARIREAPQLFQPPVLGRLRLGQAIDTTTYIERRRELDQMRRAAAGLFAHLDLLVTPTVPLLPVRIAGAKDDDAGVALFARNTRPFNAFGVPAVSIPCGVAKDGSPIGLQIVGPPWGEESVLRLAHAFEQATDWQTRRPPL